MTAVERLERAHDLLDQAVAELEEADGELPAYALEAGRFVAAEVRVARRRIANVRKALGCRG